MDDARLSGLMESLWGAGPDLVYAILDGARDPDIHPAVTGSGLPQACLFSGALGKELAAAAPYLVQMKRRDDARRIVDRGWGKSWGIFLASPASLEDLRRHFRRFLRVEDAEGKRIYFRYYDPRVLRVYLPTCTEGELRYVFGPVSRYMMEGSDPAEVLVYRQAGAKVSIEVVGAKAPAA